MEEIIPMSFDWKVFDSSLAVTRKGDFQRLLGAIDQATWDERERQSLEGRASALFTEYVGFFDSFDLCEIEYGTDNPFDVPEDLSEQWGGLLSRMEHRVEVLSEIVARRERVRVTPRFGPLKVEGQGAEQHGKILDGFDRLYKQAKQDELAELRTPVMELVKLYEALREEGLEVDQFEQLEQLLAKKDIDRVAIQSEIQRLENPERRYKVSWLEAGWEVGSEVLRLLKSGEITWEEANGAAKTRHERIQDGLHRVMVRDGFIPSYGLDELLDFNPLYERTNDLESTLALEVAERYDALAKKGCVDSRFERFEQLLADEDVTWEALEEEVERLEGDVEAIDDHGLEQDKGKIRLREVAWLAAKTLSSKEITGEQVAEHIAYLSDQKNRESISWREVAVLGSRAAWNAMTSDSSEGITWQQVETVIGSRKYKQNAESVSPEHLAWLGLKLFEADKITLEDVNDKLTYLVNPDNRKKIGWQHHMWLIARQLGQEEFSWEELKKDVDHLEVANNRGKIDWVEAGTEGAAALWKAWKTGSTLGVAWKDVKELLGSADEEQEISWWEAGQRALTLRDRKELSWEEAAAELVAIADLSKRESVSLRELGWFASQLLGQEEITLEGVQEEIAFLADRNNRENLSWWQIARQSAAGLWGSNKDGTGMNISWRHVEKVVIGSDPFDNRNDEPVSAVHMAWLGAKLFESEKVEFDQLEQHLTYLVNPENRKKIGWWTVLKTGVKALWGTRGKDNKAEAASDREFWVVLAGALILVTAYIVIKRLVAYATTPGELPPASIPVTPPEPPPAEPLTPLVPPKPPTPPTPPPQTGGSTPGFGLHNGVWGWHN